MTSEGLTPSTRRRRRSQLCDHAQDFGEEISRDGDLGHLEGDIAAVTDHLRTDFYELLPEGLQRPIFYRLRRRQSTQEVAELVGECVKLEMRGIGGEGAE
jgi:hypothetical protein